MRSAVTGNWIAGVDGCRGGWVVALRRAGSREFRIRLLGPISDLWEGELRPRVVAIDIPISLLDRAVPGGRSCDRAARRILGEPRGRSVFSPPTRPALTARSFEDAVRANRATSRHDIAISRQSFGILPKIREVDRFLTPGRQRVMVEAHPELVFRALNRDVPIGAPKKSKDGPRVRIRLLERLYGRRISRLVEEHRSS